jgi:hypothetical protein
MRQPEGLGAYCREGVEVSFSSVSMPLDLGILDVDASLYYQD